MLLKSVWPCHPKSHVEILFVFSWTFLKPHPIDDDGSLSPTMVEALHPEETRVVVAAGAVVAAGVVAPGVAVAVAAVVAADVVVAGAIIAPHVPLSSSSSSSSSSS